MHRLALVLALATFFINPGFGCAPPEPEFKYGEAEMKSAVEGKWLLTLRAADGKLSETTLQVAESSGVPADGMAGLSPAKASRRAGVIRSAMACGTRTFVKSADACIDVSEMPLDVTVVAGDARLQAASPSGILRISSLVFTEGQFDLHLGDISVFARITPSGDAISATGGSVDLTVVSLARTAPQP